MRWLRSVRLRLFLAVFAVCAPFFATNVVREHYPAFALSQRGDLRCDDFVVAGEPLISDLFQHRDGHWYANNQVGASLVAAPVLWLSSPLLDRMESIGKAQSAKASQPGGVAPSFDSAYPRRARFFAEVFRLGLHLRLPAAAALCAVLLMAPAAALLALLFHDELRRRGVAAGRAVLLSLLLPLLTPLLFRSAILNHNQLAALLTFAAFVLLRPGSADTARDGRRLLGGAACAAGTLLFDYSGAVIAAAFGLATVLDGWRAAAPHHGARAALRRAGLFALGALPPLALLGFTQWWQFGDPFRPAQHWMPDAHHSVEGYRGLGLPDLALLSRNLFDPSFGLFAFAPLLLLAFWPFRRDCLELPPRPEDAARSVSAPDVASLDIAPGERRFVLSFAAAFALFCAANRFTDLQWNTGFRCLAPVAPLLALLAAVPLSSGPVRRVAWLVAPFALHSLVLAMFRFTSPLRPDGFLESTLARSWGAFFERGIQLPWLTAWRQSQGGGPAWSGFAATLLLATIALVGAWLWRAGARAAAEVGR